MSPRRNILVLITPGFASSEAESSCLPLQQALVRAWQRVAPWLDVRVLALHYPFQEGTYAFSGATVHAFAGRNRGGLARWKRRGNVLRTLAKLKREHNVRGIVSCWYGEAAALGSAFARRHGVPHFCWLLGQDARAANDWPRRLRLREQELVALSQTVRDECAMAHGVRPAHVITPGVDAHVSSESIERRELLVGVGSLIPLKRWPVFLQVVSMLKERHPSLEAVLIGEGPELADLQRQAKMLRLEGVVHFTGALPHEQVLQWMRKARLLIHPSEYEGYSGVCQEALTQGTPVVSFCSPGATLPGGWFAVDSVEAMTKRASSLLMQPCGIPAQGFPVDETAKQWLVLLGIYSDDNTLRSPAAIAPGEKCS
ncbi:MAG: glycosyltransferase [Chitinophagaceae bacterium]|nr:MAG: glycosyltransferase [Chitinophagaceae bacterium]